MAESMKDYETELEASFKKIEEGDILTGTVISVDEKEVVIDMQKESFLLKITAESLDFH